MGNFLALINIKQLFDCLSEPEEGQDGEASRKHISEYLFFFFSIEFISMQRWLPINHPEREKKKKSIGRGLAMHMYDPLEWFPPKMFYFSFKEPRFHQTGAIRLTNDSFWSSKPLLKKDKKTWTGLDLFSDSLDYCEFTDTTTNS